jgi:tetratricopeptide (TPR) repeat protein
MVAAVTLNQAHLALRRQRADEAWTAALESLEAARDAGDAHSEVRAYITLAQLPAEHASTQRRQRAFAERGVELARVLRRPSFTSSANNALGLLQAAKDDPRAAHTSFRRAMTAANRTGNPDRQAVTLQNLAAVSSDLGHFRYAVQYLERAVEKASAVPSQARVDELMESLARNQYRMGDPKAAIATSEALLARLDNDAPTPDYARVLALHGALLADVERTGEALEVLNRARTLLSEFALEDSETVRATTNLAFAHLRAGTIPTVVDQMPAWLDALPESERGPVGKQLALMAAEDPNAPEFAIAPLLAAALDGRPAADRTVQALTLAAQMRYCARQSLAIDLLRNVYEPRRKAGRDSELTLSVRNDLALSLIRRGQPKDVSEARKLLEANLQSAERRDDRITAHLARVNLTELARRQDDPTAALGHAHRALELSTGLGDRELMFIDALQIARVHTDLGHPGYAARALARARKYVGSRAQEADLAEASGRNALLDGRPGDAAHLYREAIRKAPRDAPRQDAFESLAGLLEAYAAAGRRRSFNRNLQQLIDLAQELPHDEMRVVTFLRLANAWSARGRPAFAGQMLALAIMIAGVHASSARPVDHPVAVSGHDREGSDEDVELEYAAPLFVAVGAVAATLRDESIVGKNAELTRKGLVDELERHLSHELAETLVGLVDQALAIDDDEDKATGDATDRRFQTGTRMP